LVVARRPWEGLMRLLLCGKDERGGMVFKLHLEARGFKQALV